MLHKVTLTYRIRLYVLTFYKIDYLNLITLIKEVNYETYLPKKVVVQHM